MQLYRCHTCRLFKSRSEFGTQKSGRRRDNCEDCTKDRPATSEVKSMNDRIRAQNEALTHLQYVINGWARSD